MFKFTLNYPLPVNLFGLHVLYSYSYLQDDDELVMETFYHKGGTVYCCVYQGGQRFYLDSWQTQVSCENIPLIKV